MNMRPFHFPFFHGVIAKSLIALIAGSLLACAGMSGPGDAQQAGGPVAAAAPNYPTGVAAPSLDDSINHGGIKFANASFTVAEDTPADGSPASNFRVKGTLVCRLEKYQEIFSCHDGLTLRIIDSLQKKSVETRLKTNGSFEANFSFDPKVFPGGTDFKAGMLFLLNIYPKFNAPQYDKEISCGDLCQEVPEPYLSVSKNAAVNLVETPSSQ